jgi:hypothetical protein
LTVESLTFGDPGNEYNVKIQAENGHASGTSINSVSVKSSTKEDSSQANTVTTKPKNYAASKQRNDIHLDMIGNNGYDDSEEYRKLAKINESTQHRQMSRTMIRPCPPMM